MSGVQVLQGALKQVLLESIVKTEKSANNRSRAELLCGSCLKVGFAAKKAQVNLKLTQAKVDLLKSNEQQSQ